MWTVFTAAPLQTVWGICFRDYPALQQTSMLPVFWQICDSKASYSASGGPRTNQSLGFNRCRIKTYHKVKYEKAKQRLVSNTNVSAVCVRGSQRLDICYFSVRLWESEELRQWSWLSKVQDPWDVRRQPRKSFYKPLNAAAAEHVVVGVVVGHTGRDSSRRGLYSVHKMKCLLL